MSDSGPPSTPSQFVPLIRAAANAIRAAGIADLEERRAALKAALDAGFALGTEDFAGTLAVVAEQIGGHELEGYMSVIEAEARDMPGDDAGE